MGGGGGGGGGGEGEGGIMMYVSRMNFKCDGFAFGRVGRILVSILPILMSFVAISSVFHQSRPCWLSQFYLNRASLEIG